jgi:hypothetical protein
VSTTACAARISKTYLDEVVFRFNRRGNRHAGFARLLAIGLDHKPVTYSMSIAPDDRT